MWTGRGAKGLTALHWEHNDVDPICLPHCSGLAASASMVVLHWCCFQGVGLALGCHGSKQPSVQVFWRLSIASKQTQVPLRSLEIQGHRLVPEFPITLLEKMTGGHSEPFRNNSAQNSCFGPSHFWTHKVTTGTLRWISTTVSFSPFIPLTVEGKEWNLGLLSS